MKQLRVLTGAHAGALLLLSPKTYLISADSDADLQITDWTADPLTLALQDEAPDMSSATISLSPDAAEVPFPDLQPRRFGDVVLCVGPADVEWPSDVELMRLLWQDCVVRTGNEPAPMLTAPAPAGRARRVLVYGTAAALPLALLAGIWWIARPQTPELLAPSKTPLAQVLSLVERSGLSGIDARQAGSAVVVEGLLANEAEVARLRAALSGLPAGMIQSRFAAANELTRSIAEAFNAPGVTVRYLGRGEFLAEGAAVGAERLNAAAERLLNDLRPLVRDIRLAVTDLPAPAKLPTGAMLRTRGLEYVQTRDGTKYLSLISVPPAQVAANDGGSPSYPQRHLK